MLLYSFKCFGKVSYYFLLQCISSEHVWELEKKRFVPKGAVWAAPRNGRDSSILHLQIRCWKLAVFYEGIYHLIILFCMKWVRWYCFRAHWCFDPICSSQPLSFLFFSRPFTASMIHVFVSHCIMQIPYYLYSKYWKTMLMFIVTWRHDAHWLVNMHIKQKWFSIESRAAIFFPAFSKAVTGGQHGSLKVVFFIEQSTVHDSDMKRLYGLYQY